MRADIYAVGGTLYYLLTGRPPFIDRDPEGLLSKIATESPASPRVVASTVPEGLAAIVLACLAKDKAGRPGSYAELGGLLEPFSSAVPRRVLLRSRFAAAAIDYLLLSACFYVSTTAVFALGVRVAWAPIRLVVVTLYFTLTETYAGASIGKWLLGLRVQATEGGAPGTARVLARSLIFVVAWEALSWVPFGFWFWLAPQPEPGFRQMQERLAWLSAIVLVKSVVTPFVPLALFLSARSRYGFAGIHELISGTRVLPASSARLASRLVASDRAPVLAESAATPALQTRGPFLLVRQLAPTGSFWLAVDPLLKREVWIHDLPIGGSLSSAARRDLSRPGRLRWLAGQRTPTGSWEAFEAPGGQALLALIVKPQSWETVRPWLIDLGEELKHLDDSDRLVLGLDRVWITGDNHAKLLDFAAPGLARMDEATGQSTVHGSDAVRAFLRRVISSALAGRVASASDDPPTPRPPLPQSSQSVVRGLTEPRWSGVETWLDACKESAREPSAVPWWSRAFPSALMAISLRDVPPLDLDDRARYGWGAERIHGRRFRIQCAPQQSGPYRATANRRNR